MPLYGASGGGWHIPKSMRYGGSAVRSVRVAIGGAWRTVWATFSATAEGGSFGRNNGNSNVPRTIATAVGVTALPVGGSGNYSYSWTITGSSGVTAVSLSNAGSQGATVNATCSINTRGSVDVQCVVTDVGLGLSTVVSARTSYNYYSTV